MLGRPRHIPRLRGLGPHGEKVEQHGPEQLIDEEDEYEGPVAKRRIAEPTPESYADRMDRCVGRREGV